MGLISGVTRRIARRSQWLAKRLWIIAALEVAWIANAHWHRLELEERRRLRELAVKSKGRPQKNLSARERREAEDLLHKLDYAELGGSVTRRVIPFPSPFGRIVEFALDRTDAGRERDPGK